MFVCRIWKLSLTCEITCLAGNCGTDWGALSRRTYLSKYSHIFSHLWCIAQADIFSALVHRIKL